MNINKPALAVLTSTVLLATGCATTDTLSSVTSKYQSKKSKEISLNFQAIAPKVTGNKGILSPINCQDTFALGNPVSKTKIADVRFYVTNIHAITKDGAKLPVTLNENNFQQADVGLIDLENGTGACSDRGDTMVNRTLTGTLPKKVKQANIVGVSFDVAVPSDRNHTLANDPSTKPPLDIQGMAWSWQMGRKFAKIEIAPEQKLTMKDGTKAKIHNLHLGKVGCKGDAEKGEVVNCKFSNTPSISLTSAYPLAKQTIVLNLSKLYADSDITQDKGKKAGCMSFMGDPECKALLNNMGVDYMTGKSNGNQTVFMLKPNNSKSLTD